MTNERTNSPQINPLPVQKYRDNDRQEGAIADERGRFLAVRVERDEQNPKHKKSRFTGKIKMVLVDEELKSVWNSMYDEDEK